MSSFLEQYDSAECANRFALVREWMKTNPIELFEELRDHRPVLATPGPTLLAKFEDIFEILRYPKIFTVDLNKPKMGPFMLAHDGTPMNWTDKSVMRSLLSLSDLPRVREMVARFTDASLDSCCGCCELVDRVGRAVPVQLVNEYFGFPGPDPETMKRWSRTAQIDSFFNLPFQGLPNSEEVHAANMRTNEEMKNYLIGMVRQRAEELKTNPQRDDVVSRLLKSRLTETIGFGMDRVISCTIGLLIGAVETTSLAIIHVIDQLLSRPVHLEGARMAARTGNDELLDRYVWEALRFRPFIPYLTRQTSQDYTIARGTERQHTIPAGTTVLALTMSAMFDPNFIWLPREFRTDRPPHTNLHLGFGHHECLGIHVAEVMIPEAVKRVILRKGLRRAPGPDGQVDYQGGPLPERLVVEFDR
jgi:cytochrome P450